MKRAMLMAMFLAGLVSLLGCPSGDNAVGPLSTSYDQSTMFKVEVVNNYGNGSGQVRVYWLVDAFSGGGQPFSFGPTGDVWKNISPNSLSVVMKIDGRQYYTYLAVVIFGKSYGVGAGPDWSKGMWLTPERQAGSPYYNSTTTNMSFTAFSNFTVQTH